MQVTLGQLLALPALARQETLASLGHRACRTLLADAESAATLVEQRARWGGADGARDEVYVNEEVGEEDGGEEERQTVRQLRASRDAAVLAVDSVLRKRQPSRAEEEGRIARRRGSIAVEDEAKEKAVTAVRSALARQRKATAGTGGKSDRAASSMADVVAERRRKAAEEANARMRDLAHAESEAAVALRAARRAEREEEKARLRRLAEAKEQANRWSGEAARSGTPPVGAYEDEMAAERRRQEEEEKERQAKREEAARRATEMSRSGAVVQRPVDDLVEQVRDEERRREEEEHQRRLALQTEARDRGNTYSASAPKAAPSKALVDLLEKRQQTKAEELARIERIKEARERGNQWQVKSVEKSVRTVQVAKLFSSRMKSRVLEKKRLGLSHPESDSTLPAVEPPAGSRPATAMGTTRPKTGKGKEKERASSSPEPFDALLGLSPTPHAPTRPRTASHRSPKAEQGGK